MAALSPVPSNKIVESLIAKAAVNDNLKSISLDTPKQNLRGLNKPKCTKCGNVARSRCPFQSCKSCCAKAQNPCPIHVLKQNSTLPDKPPPSTIPSIEQQSTDAPSSGASWRLTSLRQLSTAFANSLRARKQLTRKDAININKWRFSKLREHIEINIEVENKAFERYLYNVRLLEEAFSTNDGVRPDEQSTLEANSEEEFQRLVRSMKVKLKSNKKRADTIRERIKTIVNEKLGKLQEWESANDEASLSTIDDEIDVFRDLKRLKKLEKERAEKTMATGHLIDKLNKARSKDDLISCLEMKSQLFSDSASEGIMSPKDMDEDELVLEGEFGGAPDLSYAMPKLCTTVNVDQDILSGINALIYTATQLAEL